MLSLLLSILFLEEVHRNERKDNRRGRFALSNSACEGILSIKHNNAPHHIGSSVLKDTLSPTLVCNDGWQLNHDSPWTSPLENIHGLSLTRPKPITLSFLARIYG